MYLLGLLAFYLVQSCDERFLVSAGDVPGYYWRDYTGEIPEDALPGGMENGSTTLIGQVLHKELIIPAKIVLSDKKAFFEWGHVEYSTDANVKVLCTNHPDQFEWVKSTSHDFKSIQNRNFIIAGYEPNAILHIGRTYTAGDIILGKLLVNDDVVLHISKEGRGIPTFLFEVLAFNTVKTTGTNVESKVVVNKPCHCEKRPLSINFFCPNVSP